MKGFNGAQVAESVNVLGVRVTALPFSGVLQMIEGWIEAGDRKYVCCVTTYGVMEAERLPGVRAAFNGAGLAVPDGMPFVWLLKRAGYQTQDRVYGPDLVLRLCDLSQEKGYKHFFYGGMPGVAEQLIVNLKARFPRLNVCGWVSPPFRSLSPEEDQDMIRRINHAKPDIVWVGLGTPKQDLWMTEHTKQLEAKICIGVGAAFDFHAGRVKQAPRWMQRSGLEWVYRLWQEPRRLWRRYILGNPAFICLMALQLLGLRKYK